MTKANLILESKRDILSVFKNLLLKALERQEAKSLFCDSSASKEASE
ncbi:hypothetical protein [Helicobacter sp. MIT 14-3879]|nr:hypothetical protein [Helicobacter sp. MIT 14-3879]